MFPFDIVLIIEFDFGIYSEIDEKVKFGCILNHGLMYIILAGRHG